jgi:hypothetical protein
VSKTLAWFSARFKVRKNLSIEVTQLEFWERYDPIVVVVKCPKMLQYLIPVLAFDFPTQLHRQYFHEAYVLAAKNLLCIVYKINYVIEQIVVDYRDHKTAVGRHPWMVQALLGADPEIRVLYQHSCQ